MSTQPQSRALAPVDEVRFALEKMEPQFQAALPAHVDPKKFVRVAMTAVQTAPALMQADRHSLYRACTMAAQDGLLPDGKEAALVVFNGKNGPMVQYMPMIAGILKKVRNSGELATIMSEVVYSGDDFDYWIDDEKARFRWKPQFFGDRGKIIGAFARATLTDGSLYVEVMSLEQIEKVRAVSRAAKNGPWVSWWEEMARKTVTRRLCKRLPMSTDIEELLRRDDDDYDLGEVVAAKTPGATPPATAQTKQPGDDAQDITPPPKQRQNRARAAVEANKAPPTTDQYIVEEIPERDGGVPDDNGMPDIPADMDRRDEDPGPGGAEEIPI